MKIRNTACGILLGLAAGAIPLAAQTIKPVASIEIAYVPSRVNGYKYEKEIKEKINLGISGEIGNWGYSVTGTGEVYIGDKPVNYSQLGTEASLRYDNTELYGSYSYGGNKKSHDLTNILSIGIRFNLGKKPEKNIPLKINAYGTLETAYSPFRNQYNTENSNEIMTAITGNFELDHKGFFLRGGGTERSYENCISLFEWSPNIQEYLISGSLGYKNLEFFLFHSCKHPIFLDESYLESYTGYDNGTYYKNSEAKTEFGVKFDIFQSNGFIKFMN